MSSSATASDLQTQPGEQACGNVEMKPEPRNSESGQILRPGQAAASPGQLAAGVTVRRLRRRRFASIYSLLLGRRRQGTGISRRAAEDELILDLQRN